MGLGTFDLDTGLTRVVTYGSRVAQFGSFKQVAGGGDTRAAGNISQISKNFEL